LAKFGAKFHNIVTLSASLLDRLILVVRIGGEQMHIFVIDEPGELSSLSCDIGAMACEK